MSIDNVMAELGLDDFEEAENWDDLENDDEFDDDDLITSRIDVDAKVRAKRIEAQLEDAVYQRRQIEALEKEAQGKKRRIRASPPGLKIFQQPFLTGFKRKDLDLERDFGYKRRAFLSSKCGLSDAEIDEIFMVPWKFILYLSPGTTSPLIRNEDDFKRILDFLFFMHVSTKSFKTAQILKKAIFQLLKTYGYSSWKLGIQHLFTTFLNLGMEEKTILDQSIYDKMLAYRKQSNNLIFEVKSKIPSFYAERSNSQSNGNVDEGGSESSDEDDELPNVHAKGSYVDIEDEDLVREKGNAIPHDYEWKALKYSILKRSVKTICDLIVTFPNLTTLVPEKNSRDWLESLVGFYVLGTVTSDWHFIMDSDITIPIQNAFRVMLDGYTRELWVTEEGGAGAESVSLDINDVFCAIGDLNDSNLHAWESDEVPKLQYATTDHHDNIARRLLLLPQTRRGNIIRKMMAYYHLQSFFQVKKFVQVPCADVVEAKKLLENNTNVFSTYHDDFYFMMSLVRLIDAMVGNEPFTDFYKSKHDDIKYISSVLSKYKENKLRKMCASNLEATVVFELVDQILNKWGFMKQVCTDGRQQLMEKYLVKKQ